MARKLPAKDVVIIGLGWTGSILAYELAKAGLDVVAIERGPWRDTAADFAPATTQDELRYAIRLDLFLRPEQDTLTFRNNMSQTALPMRNFSSFLPGNGVGSAGVHWNGQTWRFLPTDFKLRSHLEQRYGKAMLPADMTIQDWPLSYDELEPYYDRFKKFCGTHLFPRLASSPLVQSDDPTTLVLVLLQGTRAASTDNMPTAPAMPAFGWRVDDSQAAAVLTYIRNSWGNAAPPVAASTIAKQRTSLAAAPYH